MALTFLVPERKELTPRIVVFGVGGAGGNAVNNMIEKRLEGVDFIVANTDAQALAQSKAPRKIQLGVKLTEGLGAGARPSVGAAAAEEALEEIIDHLSGSHMCFITAGMGGGTGTGAAPIIAQAARELGILTVGVVTKPFAFEGLKRMRQAEEGVAALQKVVDTLIVIPNQNLFRIANERTTFAEAFAMADDVLYQGVKGVTDLMVRPGLINLDFADVRAVMDEMGKAMMGTGEAEGADRARLAAEAAIANPLLDEVSLTGARGVLINITGGPDLTLFELDEAANLIREKVDPEANIIVGSTLDPEMTGRIRVSVVATGIDSPGDAQSQDLARRRMAEPLPLSRERTVAGAAAAAAEPQPAMRPAARVSPGERTTAAPAPGRSAATPGFDSRVAPAAAASPAPATQRMAAMPERAAVTAGASDHPGSGFAERVAAAHHSHETHEAPRVMPEMPQAAAEEAYREEFDLHAIFDEAGTNPSPSAPRHAPVGIGHAGGAFGSGRPEVRPSPEVRERLRRAVEHEAPQTARPMASAAEPKPEPRRRFGLGALISRMTGEAGSATSAEPEPHPPLQRPASRQPRPDDTPDWDERRQRLRDERIDIPAFLRRQAN